MKRKAATHLATILLLTSALYLTITILPHTARATTLYVGGSGPGNYTYIQAALDAAVEGDTVFVYNGTYYEHVIISKPLSVIGESKDTTKIISEGAPEVVYIFDDWVNFTGFSIENRNNSMSVRLASSEHANLTSNDLGTRGIYVAGLQMKYWNTHSIDETNTVNGRPVYYWKNVTGGVVPPNAGQVILANCTNVTIRDQNISDVYTGILLGFSSGNVISNVTLSGAKAGLELRYSHDNVFENSVLLANVNGFESSRSDNSLIANNSISESFHGIWIYDSNNNTLTNNTVFNNSHGAHIMSSDGNAIVDNDFSGSPYSDLMILYSGNNTVEDNTFISDQFRGGWSIRIEYGYNNRALNNWMRSYRQGMLVWDQSYAIILNNTILGGGIDIMGDLVEYWNTHVIDTSNTVNGRPVRYWKNVTGGTVQLDAGQVILANCTNVTVGNQNVHNTSSGIYMGFSNGNWVVDNTVTGSDGGLGMFNSADNYVANNTSFDNWYAITMGSSDDTLCRNNTVAYNVISVSDEGLGAGDCNNCTFANNTIYLSRERAVNLYHSENMTVKGNNILDNVVGIRAWYSENNRIYHNNFIRNLKQAYNHLYPNDNQWDDGYPSGGNYWDDYTGVDLKSGPGQNLPGSDGWGDTPYDIDASSRDRYPSMYPFGYPKTPNILRATLTGGNLENVSIEWSLSPDDGAGLMTVIGYRIFRNSTYNFRGLLYESIAIVPSGTTSFTDVGVGEGDPGNYFYQVCAFDVANQTACPRTQAGKFTRPLSEGENLVSIPLVQSDDSVETTFQTLNWDKAWTYDSNTSTWTSYMKFKPYLGQLREVHVESGYWMNVTEDSNLTVAGLVPLETNIQLKAGWNLIGFPSFSLDLTIADLKTEMNATRAEGFDPTAPPYFLRMLTDPSPLETGRGYWVNVERVRILTIGNL